MTTALTALILSCTVAMGTSLPMRPTAGDSLAADTALSKRYTYVVAADSSEMPHLSAEQLYDMAAAVVFPVSDTHLAATWLLDPRAPRIDPPIRLKAGSGKWTKT